MKPHYTLEQVTKGQILALRQAAQQNNLDNASFEYGPTKEFEGIHFDIQQYNKNWELIVTVQMTKNSMLDIYKIDKGVITYKHSEKL